jgi:hypothetical protein
MENGALPVRKTQIAAAPCDQLSYMYVVLYMEQNAKVYCSILKRHILYT